MQLPAKKKSIGIVRLIVIKQGDHLLKAKFITEISDHHVGDFNLLKTRSLEIGPVIDSRSAAGQPASDIPIDNETDLWIAEVLAIK